ncbi:spermidine synthase [Citromicrobium sp. JLT1363]|uniref:spermidine synthase n=1 Tax=Citromicrobium sp. JLT1363 TaxID=517722 RepID=UPI0002F1FDBE|nr:fused MFS/spermidine synthase [Citromicrobium sp. JLT1363]
MRLSPRVLFVFTILLGSFLLFLVQPLVARLALPQLGGAPNVWNSAMLVYQALLLGGYAYAHILSRATLRRQALVHLALMALALLTLPIALADVPQPAGWEVFWVPLLLVATIGPLFFIVAAQAPLVQRWYAADPDAGDPYWLYGASNIGSFAGLLSYPLLLEPNLSLAGQSTVWALGYGLLIACMAALAWLRWRTPLHADSPAGQGEPEDGEPIGWRRILFWLALSAVPSGLMLSTTTHLTTDIVAMPLLWVLPLGLYLLSFVFAFNERSALGFALTRTAPTILLLAGAMAMVSRGSDGVSLALAAVLMLFVVATALHRRLYASRPAPTQLTRFYLVMSAGGALGGVFAAIVAPLLFDWVWEHPLLVLAAGALLPQNPLIAWMDRLGLDARARLVARLALVAAAALLGLWMAHALDNAQSFTVHLLLLAIALLGVLALGKRWAFLAILLIAMLARGGWDTLEESAQGIRERSYFGVYTIRQHSDPDTRLLLHGTTIHGRQFLDPERRRAPTSYYGPTSGVGLALSGAREIYGPGAQIGVIGLGTGTLACYREPGQDYTFYEIDPMVVEYSRDRVFSFLADCAPEAGIHLGDARLALESEPAQQYDVLAVDAFSSDAIPLHLLTREAMHTYGRALKPDGLMLVHISNRYLDLRPVIAAHAAQNGWIALMRDDPAVREDGISASFWVAIASDPQPIARLLLSSPQTDWIELDDPAPQVWTDDFASILPLLDWNAILGGSP